MIGPESPVIRRPARTRTGRDVVLPLAVVAAVLAAAVVVVLGAGGGHDRVGARFGVLLPAATAVLTALALVFTRPAGTHVGHRRLIALGLMTWAAGQSWVAVAQAGWPRFPAAGTCCRWPPSRWCSAACC